MKLKRHFVFVLLLLVDLQVALAGTPAGPRDEVRKSRQSDRDMQERKLRALLDSTDLSQVSYLFAKSKKVTISRSKSGQLRIFVGDVSEELLRTRITRISFGTTERYNEIDAIIAITRTKEIQAKLRELGVKQPLAFYPGASQGPDRRVPHLPTSIRDVTMEDAMDHVAETFGCLIIYARWTVNGTPLFNVGFAQGEDFEGLGRKR